MQSVMVTGAAGFLGTAICRHLRQHGYAVIEVRRPANVLLPSPEAVAPTVVYVDLQIAGSLACAWQPWAATQRCLAVIHLAAVLPPALTGPASQAAAQANQGIDHEVFHFAQQQRVPVIYASSTSVYGPGNGDRQTEVTPVQPLGAYATGKLASEQLGAQMLQQVGQPFTALRISAPYGPGQRTPTVMRHFIDRARQGLPLLYHGSGRRQQDFIYVDDVAAALLAALQQPRHDCYVIASGQAISMRDLAALIVQVTPQCRSLVLPSGEADPQEGRTVAYDPEKAWRHLGWRPGTPLQHGIEQASAATS